MDDQHRRGVDPSDRAAEVVADRAVTLLLALGIGAAVLFTVLHVANSLAFDGRFAWLDLGVEGGPATWTSASITFGAAYVALLHGVSVRDRRLLYVLLALVLAYVSLDDAVAVHEAVSRRVGDLGLPAYLSHRIDFVFLLPVYLTGGILLLKLSRIVSARPAYLLRLGLVVLVISILIDEVVEQGLEFVIGEGPSTADSIRIGFEEGIEVVGWTLVTAAMAYILIVELAALGSSRQRSLR